MMGWIEQSKRERFGLSELVNKFYSKATKNQREWLVATYPQCERHSIDKS